MQIQTDSRTDSIIFWATSAERARAERARCIRQARETEFDWARKSWANLAHLANWRVIQSLRVLREHAENKR